MTWQELQNQALHLPIGDRWRLVQSLLSSIEQETVISSESTSTTQSLPMLDPWTQSLIGIIQLEQDKPEEAYIEYLEKKYS